MSVDNKRFLKLVVIDSDEKTAHTVKTHFADKGIRLAGEAVQLKAGMRLVRTLRPELVLIEMPAGSPEDTLDAVRAIHAELPDCGIILSSEGASSQLILAGMRGGAQEFVGRPVDAPELESAIGHMRARLDRRPSGRRRGSMIGVFSSKGGSGCSMVAANLAGSLVRRAGTRVALVDLNFQLGDLSLLLDLQPRYGLADVVGSAALEEAQLRSALAPHDSGLSLLTMAGAPEDGNKIERQHLVDVFGVLSNMFDYIVVDIERHIDERGLEALDLSERILLVSTLGLPSVRNTKRYLELFGCLDIDGAKCEIVVNRHDTKRTGVSIRDLESTVGRTASWLIPNEYAIVTQSIDSGVPFVFSAPSSRIARSFQEYAARITAGSDTHKDVRANATPAGLE